MSEKTYAKSGIYLGYPLDQLLHRDCRVMISERDDPIDQAILFARDGHPGSGNIVIMGPPGSGKSTLGLHIARACAARPENQCYSAYFSLECTAEETLQKARMFWPNPKEWQIAASLPVANGGTTSTSRAEALCRLLVSGSQECPIGKGKRCDRKDCPACEPLVLPRHSWPEVAARVLLMSLAPRPTSGRAEDHTAAFWNRYAQLENLLTAAYELRTRVQRKGDPAHASVANWVLPLMVIDSLNMMAEGMPTRDQLLPLFHLFRKYETTGVFLVESSTPTPFDSTLADVVIQLTVDEDQGYSARYFEVVKSRYRNQINGRHPYKTAPAPKRNRDGRIVNRPPIPRKPGDFAKPAPSGMLVLPSVHYAILRGFFPEKGAGNLRPYAWKSRKAQFLSSNSNEPPCKPGTYWGINTLDSVLPEVYPGSAILIEGPSGTYKTNLAATFLASGLADGERVMLVRLHDDPMIRTSRREPGCAAGPALSTDIEDFTWSSLTKLCEVNPEGDADTSAESWQALADPRKATITVWQGKVPAHSPDKSPRLYEIDFKTGHLLAEEFIQFIRNIIIRQPRENAITRVVLDDVSEIGVAYPFLRNSATSGDILLPSLVHLMKDNDVDLIVTGTTGIHPLADDAVARVRGAADTVIRTRYVDVFGRKYVVVEGEGLIASATKDDADSRSAPATIENLPGTDTEDRKFRVDQDRLRGLVGFDQDRIYRSGISLQLFEETGTVHGSYNKDVLAMLRAAFASPEGLGSGQQSASTVPPDRSPVALTTFGPEYSAAVHDGLDILAESAPINGTVVCSVDEFIPDDESNKHFTRIPESLQTWKPREEQNRGDEGHTKGNRLFSYYRNVLFVAYRTDVFKLAGDSAPVDSWQALKKLVETIREPFPAVPGLPPLTHRFGWDRTASETLTCAFLDLLWFRKRAVKDFDILLKSNTSEESRHIEDELTAFQSLFGMASEWSGEEPDKPIEANAAAYLVWYSQLRELIARNPKLAGLLNVMALPNGGFRGDWRIGVRSGSASAHLGIAVLDKLLSKAQDYKRFVKGVGLPCMDDIGHLAWPLADESVTLAKVLNIHAEARSRSDLGHGPGRAATNRPEPQYKTARLALHAAALQLVLPGTRKSFAVIRENLLKRIKQLA